MTSPLAIENAVVSGLSRALASAGPPPLPTGWPSNEAAHDALIAGDAHLRGTTAAAADSAYRHYQRARQADAASPIMATRLALAAAAIAERGGTIPDAGTTPSGEFARRLKSARSQDHYSESGFSRTGTLCRP
jgi:hypothetical protein